MRRAPKYVLLGAVPAALSGAAARGWIGAAVGACVGAIGGAVTSLVMAPECPPGRPVLLIGDSLAVGLAPPMVQLAQACGVPFAAAAEVGSHVTQWDGAMFDGAIAELGAIGLARGTVLVSLGGNDYQRRDVAAVNDAIAGLLARIRDAGGRPRWIAPPKLPFADTAGVVALWRYHLAALGRGDPWRGYYPTAEVTVPIAPDGIHPTPKGYAMLASAIWRWLALVES